MKIKIICITLILLGVILAIQPITLADDTTLEIVEVKGSLASVVVSVKNVGDVTAEKIAVTTSVTGGLFNNIDLTHACTGCSSCGSTLASGEIKVENTAEAGYLLGIGPIEINVATSASNADEVTGTYTGFIIGPIIIIN